MGKGNSGGQRLLCPAAVEQTHPKQILRPFPPLLKSMPHMMGDLHFVESRVAIIMLQHASNDRCSYGDDSGLNGTDICLKHLLVIFGYQDY